MSAQQDKIFGLYPQQIIVPPGATNAVLIQNVAGEVGMIIKYFSGGSCQIINAPPGATLTGPQLVSYGNTGGYLLGTTEAVSVDGPARFYLQAYGATTIIMLLKGLSSPNTPTAQ